MFYFDKYVYFVDSYAADDSGLSEVELYRWDSEADELETVFKTEGNGLPGSKYTLWVEAEDRIYIAPVSIDENTADAKVCLVSKDTVEELFGIDDKGPVRLLNGICLQFNFGADAQKSSVSIWDYEGNKIYEGNWERDFIDGIDASEYGVNSVFGGRDAVYFIYLVHDANDDRTVCAVKYDISGDAPEPMVIGIFKD